MSESVEEYLEAIYNFNERGETAKNQSLAEKLRVAPASVTQMVKKLANDALVTYEPYKGAVLTGKGMARAQKVVRKHRLIERFLYDTLGMGREKVHDEACRLEHHLSDEAAAALCDTMDRPKTCPDDGKLIPPCILETSNCEQCKEVRTGVEVTKLLTQLSHLKHGEKATIQFIRAGRNATQRVLDMGLCPGTEISVENSAPFHGPIEIEVRGTRIALGRGLAEKIFVEVEPNNFDESHPHGPHHLTIH